MAKYTNTNTQIHKYTYTQIQFLPKSAEKSAERDHQFTRGFTRRAPRVKKKLYHHLRDARGQILTNDTRCHSLGTPETVVFWFLLKP